MRPDVRIISKIFDCIGAFTQDECLQGSRIPKISKKRIRDLFIKTCSLATSIAFFVNILSYDVVLSGFSHTKQAREGQAWAIRSSPEFPHVGSVGSGPGRHKKVDIANFAFPEYLGSVIDRYSPRPEDEEAAQKIILIQDAHCDYAAQRRIAEIIHYLKSVYDIQTVNLEGGKEGYDLSMFTEIEDAKLREEVSDYFVFQGLLSGAEYFAINNSQSVDLWGIEDARLYLDNLKAYRDFLPSMGEVNSDLRAIGNILNSLKLHIYSEKLMEFDLKYAQYKAGNLDFKEYLKYLISGAKENDIDLKAFPNINLLNESIEKEKLIDFKKANDEKDYLVKRLCRTLSKKEIKELTAAAYEFENKHISRAVFYEYLTAKGKEAGIKVEKFGELNKYIEYVSLYHAADKSKTVEEVAMLEEKIKNSLCQNKEQEELSRLSKNLTLLKNFFNATLTLDDYRYYEKNRRGFDARNYTSFIKKQAPRYKITANLPKNIRMFDRYREEMNKFYEYSFKRDKAFIENIKFSTPGTQTSDIRHQTSVLIAGGFHTDNLCKLFRDKGIPHISIMPNFKDPEGYKNPYKQLLAGEQNPIEANISRILGFSIAIASLLSGLSEEVYGPRGKLVFQVYKDLVAAKMRGEDGIKVQAGTDVLGYLNVSGSIATEGELENFSIAMVEPVAEPTEVEVAGIEPAAVEARSVIVRAFAAISGLVMRPMRAIAAFYPQWQRRLLALALIVGIGIAIFTDPIPRDTAQAASTQARAAMIESLGDLFEPMPYDVYFASKAQMEKLWRESGRSGIPRGFFSPEDGTLFIGTEYFPEDERIQMDFAQFVDTIKNDASLSESDRVAILGTAYHEAYHALIPPEARTMPSIAIDFGFRADIFLIKATDENYKPMIILNRLKNYIAKEEIYKHVDTVGEEAAAYILGDTLSSNIAGISGLFDEPRERHEEVIREIMENPDHGYDLRTVVQAFILSLTNKEFERLVKHYEEMGIKPVKPLIMLARQEAGGRAMEGKPEVMQTELGTHAVFYLEKNAQDIEALNRAKDAALEKIGGKIEEFEKTGEDNRMLEVLKRVRDALRVRNVEEVRLFAAVDIEGRKLNAHINEDGVISIPVDQLGNILLLASGLSHEEAHSIVRSVYGTENDPEGEEAIVLDAGVATFGPLIQVSIDRSPDGAYSIKVESIDPSLRMDDPRVEEAINKALMEAIGEPGIDPEFKRFLEGMLEQRGFRFKQEISVTFLINEEGARVLSASAPLVIASTMPMAEAGLAKGTLWFIGGAIFALMRLFGIAITPARRNFVEDYIIPLLEEGGMFLGLYFGGPFLYLGIRGLFTLLHALQDRAPPAGVKRTLLQRTTIPALASIAASLPLLALAFGTPLGPAIFAAIAGAGIFAHILGNRYVTVFKSRLQKAVLGVEEGLPAVLREPTAVVAAEKIRRRIDQARRDPSGERETRDGAEWEIKRLDEEETHIEKAVEVAVIVKALAKDLRRVLDKGYVPCDVKPNNNILNIERLKELVESIKEGGDIEEVNWDALGMRLFDLDKVYDLADVPWGEVSYFFFTTILQTTNVFFRKDPAVINEYLDALVAEGVGVQVIGTRELVLDEATGIVLEEKLSYEREKILDFIELSGRRFLSYSTADRHTKKFLRESFEKPVEALSKSLMERLKKGDDPQEISRNIAGSKTLEESLDARTLKWIRSEGVIDWIFSDLVENAQMRQMLKDHPQSFDLENYLLIRLTNASLFGVNGLKLADERKELEKRRKAAPRAPPVVDDKGLMMLVSIGVGASSAGGMTMFYDTATFDKDIAKLHELLIGKPRSEWKDAIWDFFRWKQDSDEGGGLPEGLRQLRDDQRPFSELGRTLKSYEDLDLQPLVDFVNRYHVKENKAVGEVGKLTSSESRPELKLGFKVFRKGPKEGVRLYKIKETPDFSKIDELIGRVFKRTPSGKIEPITDIEELKAYLTTLSREQAGNLLKPRRGDMPDITSRTAALILSDGRAIEVSAGSISNLEDGDIGAFSAILERAEVDQRMFEFIQDEAEHLEGVILWTEGVLGKDPVDGSSVWILKQRMFDEKEAEAITPLETAISGLTPSDVVDGKSLDQISMSDIQGHFRAIERERRAQQRVLDEAEEVLRIAELEGAPLAIGVAENVDWGTEEDQERLYRRIELFKRIRDPEQLRSIWQGELKPLLGEMLQSTVGDIAKDVSRMRGEEFDKFVIKSLKFEGAGANKGLLRTEIDIGRKEPLVIGLRVLMPLNENQPFMGIKAMTEDEIESTKINSRGGVAVRFEKAHYIDEAGFEDISERLKSHRIYGFIVGDYVEGTLINRLPYDTENPEKSEKAKTYRDATKTLAYHWLNTLDPVSGVGKTLGDPTGPNFVRNETPGSKLRNVVIIDLGFETYGDLSELREAVRAMLELDRDMERMTEKGKEFFYRAIPEAIEEYLREQGATLNETKKTAIEDLLRRPVMTPAAKRLGIGPRGVFEGPIEGPFQVEDTVFNISRVTDPQDVGDALGVWFSSGQSRVFGENKWIEAAGSYDLSDDGIFLKIESDHGEVLGIAHFHRGKFTFDEEQGPVPMYIADYMEVSELFQGKDLGTLLVAKAVETSINDRKVNLPGEIVFPPRGGLIASEKERLERFYRRKLKTDRISVEEDTFYHLHDRTPEELLMDTDYVFSVAAAPAAETHADVMAELRADFPEEILAKRSLDTEGEYVEMIDDKVMTNTEGQMVDAQGREILGGRYIIAQNEKGEEVIIGEGTGGTVYYADDTQKLDRAALKVSREGQEVMLLREAAILEYLKERGVDGVIDFRDIGMVIADEVDADGNETGLKIKSYYLAMGLIDGVPLDAVLRSRDDGVLPAGDAWLLFQRVFGILKELHANGVLHMDIKPENIFVPIAGYNAQGEPIYDFSEAVLGDFGWSAKVDDIDRTKVVKVSPGTRGFMSPQALNGHFSGRSDLYALGMTLYDSITDIRVDEGVRADFSRLKAGGVSVDMMEMIKILTDEDMKSAKVATGAVSGILEEAFERGVVPVRGPVAAPGKGVIWFIAGAVFALMRLFGIAITPARRNFIEDYIVPLLEEGGMLLGLYFGGPLIYLGIRGLFVALHAFQDRAPPEGVKRTILQRIAIPAIASLAALTPLAALALGTPLSPLIFALVAGAGIFAHILGNRYVTEFKSRLQKAVLGVAPPAEDMAATVAGYKAAMAAAPVDDVRRMNEIMESPEQKAEYERSVVEPYHALMGRLLDEMDPDGEASIVYPFMGPDVVPATFRETISINDDPDDIRKGKIVMKRVFGRDLSLGVSDKSVVGDAAEIESYEYLKDPNRKPCIFMMKGFLFIGAPAEQRKAILANVFNNLREGDKIVALTSKDVAILKEAGVVKDAEPEVLYAGRDRFVHETGGTRQARALLMPDALMVLEKRGDSFAQVSIPGVAAPLPAPVPVMFNVADQSTAPRLSESRALNARYVDLKAMPAGTLIHYDIADGHWDYTLRIEENGQVSIWLRGDPGRITAPAGTVGTWPEDMEAKGTLDEDQRAYMPYFDYVRPPDAEEIRLVRAGAEGFIYSPQKIRIQLPEGAEAPQGAVQIISDEEAARRRNLEIAEDFVDSIQLLAYAQSEVMTKGEERAGDTRRKEYMIENARVAGRDLGIAEARIDEAIRVAIETGDREKAGAKASEIIIGIVELAGGPAAEMLEKNVLRETGAAEVAVIDVHADPSVAPLDIRNLDRVRTEAANAARQGKVVKIDLKNLMSIEGRMKRYRAAGTLLKNISEGLSQFQGDTENEISYPVLEILKNAVVHGNRLDLTRPVFMFIQLDALGKADSLKVYDMAMSEREAPDPVAMKDAKDAGLHGSSTFMREIGQVPEWKESYTLDTERGLAFIRLQPAVLRAVPVAEPGVEVPGQFYYDPALQEILPDVEIEPGYFLLEFGAKGPKGAWRADDEDTLAGRIIVDNYGKLVERTGPRKILTINEFVDMGGAVRKGFEEKVGELGMEAKASHTHGQSEYHYNGKEAKYGDFMLYYHKSGTEYRDVGAGQVRAYITLNPDKASEMHEHFINLTQLLIKAGIDFNAKAASPDYVYTRTDNMVFYIASYHQGEAAEIIRNYLREHPELTSGQGAVVAAKVDPAVEGLSWAREPSNQEIWVWQQVSGSTLGASYNMVAATLAVPDYLERLASLQEERGNAPAAEEFRAEAERTRKVIAQAREFGSRRQDRLEEYYERLGREDIGPEQALIAELYAYFTAFMDVYKGEMKPEFFRNMTNDTFRVLSGKHVDKAKDTRARQELLVKLAVSIRFLTNVIQTRRHLAPALVEYLGAVSTIDEVVAIFRRGGVEKYIESLIAAYKDRNTEWDLETLAIKDFDDLHKKWKDFRKEKVALPAAEALYDAGEDLLPGMLEIVRRGAKTRTLSPVSREQKADAESRFNEIQKALGEEGRNLDSRYYAFDVASPEEGITTMISEKRLLYNTLRMHNEDVARDTKTRLIIRLPVIRGKSSRGRLESAIREMLAEINTDKKTGEVNEGMVETAFNRLRIIEADYGEKMETNPVIDIFEDTSMMEIDRYKGENPNEGEYAGEAPFSLKENLARLINLSLDGIATPEGANLERLTGNNLYNILKQLFNGTAYMVIKRIDWESIRDKMEAEEAVLRAL